MSKGFKITQRHYDIIIRQVNVNYPKECGGFLGGKDKIISAILPTFNQHLFSKTDTFAITPDDILRAHKFFEKHGLKFYGTYHSHPKGAAIPSAQDLKHSQKYLFIISLRDKDNPDFAAFEVHGSNYKRIPLIIHKGKYEVLDIFKGKKGKDAFLSGEPADLIEESERLNELLNEYITEDKIKYHKMPPKKGNDKSDFSTLA